MSWRSQVHLPGSQPGGDDTNAWTVLSPHIDPSICRQTSGTTIAHYQFGDESFEIKAKSRTDYLLSFSDIVHFLVNQEAMTVQPVCRRQDELELVGLLLANSVSAFLLSLRGSVALHASAVVVNEQAIVICGPSNQGKSTLAAALCAAGAALLTDDTLAWHDDTTRALAYRGVTDIRLRQPAAKLARTFGTASRSPDGRLVVRPRVAQGNVVPIALVVHPTNQPNTLTPSTVLLGGTRAHAPLLAATRIGSWTTNQQRIKALKSAHRLAQLCRNVELTVSLRNTSSPEARHTLLQVLQNAAENS